MVSSKTPSDAEISTTTYLSAFIAFSSSIWIWTNALWVLSPLRNRDLFLKNFRSHTLSLATKYQLDEDSTVENLSILRVSSSKWMLYEMDIANARTRHSLLSTANVLDVCEDWMGEGGGGTAREVGSYKFFAQVSAGIRFSIHAWRKSIATPI